MVTDLNKTYLMYILWWYQTCFEFLFPSRYIVLITNDILIQRKWCKDTRRSITASSTQEYLTWRARKVFQKLITNQLICVFNMKLDFASGFKGTICVRTDLRYWILCFVIMITSVYRYIVRPTRIVKQDFLQWHNVEILFWVSSEPTGNN